MTASAAPAAFPCPRCGTLLFPGQLVCPNCGALVYAQRLNDLAAEAQREEAVNPIRAAMIWQQALPLLPPDSQQYRTVAQRIGALTAGLGRNWDSQLTPDQPAVPIAPPRSDPLPVAIAKTGGSMLLSILVYTFMFSDRYGLKFGAQFATGFVVLILIHELGHVVAMRYFGLSASPPIFIPFVGAVINLRQSPRNALEEAIVGIAGPVAGTIGAVVTFIVFLKTESPLLYELAEFGFFLNLINLMPIPPLDGGRVTAAVSPWIWLTGLLLVVVRLLLGFVHGHANPILILLLIFAWPRIKRDLIERANRGPYYQIGWKAMWAMGIAYVLLGGFLAVMYYLPEIMGLMDRMKA